jgi:iron complex outermembrane receptor protein
MLGRLPRIIVNHRLMELLTLSNGRSCGSTVTIHGIGRNALGVAVTLLTLVGVTFPSGTASAQPAATISGIVRDSSGAPIPGALIRLSTVQPPSNVEVVTDDHGAYTFGPLVPAEYRLAAALDGFEPVERPVRLSSGQVAMIDVTLTPARFTEGVVVTARRVEEIAQEVPIPISVLDGDVVADSGAFNVNRLKEMIPAVQFYSSNPRNSSINIRGLGSPFGLTNDGIEPGVGLYIDGTFFARAAAATLDFLDVERVEVLRGPQGTLFGKNTTAGAISVTTKRPRFTREGDLELSFGSFGMLQAKASVTGALSKTLAGRVSFSGTTRTGTIRNVATREDLNSLSNLGLRAQLLFTPSDKMAVSLSVDNTRQRPDGYAQVIAGVAPTMRTDDRQYARIAADLGYTAPSFDAFDRVTDTDTPWQSHQDLGGASLTIERRYGRGTLTSITGWRYWDWDPSNDRDFIGLPVTTISEGTSKQRQWTQEVRYAGDLSDAVNFVAGIFYFRQGVDSDPVIRQEHGAAAARFLLAPSADAATPGLLDGYGFDQYLSYRNVSAAMFGQLEWSVTDRLRLLPGLRLNYDDKFVDFDQRVYGGLQTSDPALLALKLSVLAPQAYTAAVDDVNLSGQMTAAFHVSKSISAYATYATSFKSVGLNLGGVPADAAGRPALDAAVVRPEDERHIEVGIKTELLPGVTTNVTVFNTDINDFQTQVVNANVGVLRGYLANAEKVRVRGIELDANARVHRHLSLYTSAAYNDGRYVSFSEAPPPLEETGGLQVKDISGSALAGISKWALSFGGEFSQPVTLLGRSGDFFSAVEASYRSSFSSSASASKYLVVDGYSLVNARVGLRWSDGWAVSLWARNLFDTDYFELLSAAPGNSGLYVGLPGDPRTIGVTMRMSFGARK